MKSYQINIPYQTDKELAQIELLINSGRIQERQEIGKALEELCTCEPRKLPFCTCDFLVKDLLKEFRKNL
jgi:hypothetical protein